MSCHDAVSRRCSWAERESIGMAVGIPGGSGTVERDTGVLTIMCSCSAPWSGPVDAGAAAHHHSAGHDPRGGPRDHVHPPHRRPHRRTCRRCDRASLPQAPHHTTISDVGPIGGIHVAVPGNVSLTHRGVLCPDEQPACPCHVLGGRSSAVVCPLRLLRWQNQIAELPSHQPCQHDRPHPPGHRAPPAVHTPQRRNTAKVEHHSHPS
jgi:hypothetical protein